MKNNNNVVVLVICCLVATLPTVVTWQVGISGPLLSASCSSHHLSGSGDGGCSSCLIAMHGWWAPVRCSQVVVLVVDSHLVEVCGHGSLSSSIVQPLGGGAVGIYSCS